MTDTLKPCPFCGGNNLKTGGDDKIVGVVPEVPTEEQMAAGLYQSSHDATYEDVCQSYMDMVRTPIDTPALSASPYIVAPVGVKPLEWRDEKRCSTANSLIGVYVVDAYAQNWTMFTPEAGANEDERAPSSFHDTRDAAKDAAQADYESRILSALSTPADIEPVERQCTECGQIHADERSKCMFCGGALKALAAPVADIEPVSVPDGVELAARFVEKRRDDYVREHGSYDHSTGVTEFPGDGEQYVYELEEIIEGIRALTATPVAERDALVYPRELTDVLRDVLSTMIWQSAKIAQCLRAGGAAQGDGEPRIRKALEALVQCRDDFDASVGNYEEAYNKLAKYAYPQWQEARAALAQREGE